MLYVFAVIAIIPKKIIVNREPSSIHNYPFRCPNHSGKMRVYIIFADQIRDRHKVHTLVGLLELKIINARIRGIPKEVAVMIHVSSSSMYFCRHDNYAICRDFLTIIL